MASSLVSPMRLITNVMILVVPSHVVVSTMTTVRICGYLCYLPEFMSSQGWSFSERSSQKAPTFIMAYTSVFMLSK